MGAVSYTRRDKEQAALICALAAITVSPPGETSRGCLFEIAEDLGLYGTEAAELAELTQESVMAEMECRGEYKGGDADYERSAALAAHKLFNNLKETP